ncbi:hypothetical protein [Paenibacillus humicus]|uniref:hypothetical protein n=1 Tax=Paenibacillus humicus TaxID=412861 RepID=UPI003D2A57E7
MGISNSFKIGICLIIIAFIAAGIYLSKTFEKEYEVVTDKQISKIIENEKITILNKEIIISREIPVTIIPYKTDIEVGVIEATNLNGLIDYRKAISLPINNDKRVEVFGVKNGLNYVVITFYDYELLNKTSKISVFYNNSQKSINEVGNKSSIIIPLSKISDEKKTIELISIEFFDTDNNIIFNYPSDSEPLVLNKIDYYDYYYSLKTIKLLGEEGIHKRVKNTKLSPFTNIYDIWLYVMSGQVDEKDKDKIIQFLNQLESNKGYYYPNEKEKNQGEVAKPYLYLLDTKMALEIYKSLNEKITSEEIISKYLMQAEIELNKNELDFVSKGSFIVLIDEINTILDNKRDIPKIMGKYQNDLVNLYIKTPPSLDKYYTAMKLINIYPDLGLELDKKEISKYIYKIQLSNGLFNIDGYTEGYDSLSTNLAVEILMNLNIDIPKKDRLLKNVELINKSAIVGSN